MFQVFVYSQQKKVTWYCHHLFHLSEKRETILYHPLPVPSKQKKRDNLHNQRKELLKRIITSSREKQVTKEIMISKSVVINSDDCEKCQSGLWIPDLNLFGEDKEILLSDSWLNDRLINAAQKLLQAAFPHIPGFQ